jgi:hypothetical protein
MLVGAIIVHSLSALASILFSGLLFWRNDLAMVFSFPALSFMLTLQIPIVILAAVMAPIVYTSAWTRREMAAWVLLSLAPVAITLSAMWLFLHVFLGQ